MGGTGSHSFCIHHPRIFAYQKTSSEGMTNWIEEDRYDTDAWRWGQDKALTMIDLIDYDNLIGHRDVGMTSAQWMAIQYSLVWSGAQDDVCFFNFSHGTRDGAIKFAAHAQPIYSDHNVNPFASNYIPYSAVWNDVGHSSQGSKGFNGCSAVPKTHFVLALKNSTSNEELSSECKTTTSGCNDAGQVNRRINWSTARNPINGAPVDQAMLFETTLQLNTGSFYGAVDYTGPSNPTVDITPRRLQNLHHASGTEYSWENIPAGGGSAIQSGTVTANSRGLFTIPAFRFSTAGNKLRVEVTAVVDAVIPGDNSRGAWFHMSSHPVQMGTIIRFSDGQDRPLTQVKLYSVNGRAVNLNLQNNIIIWTGHDANGRTLPSGIYILQAVYGKDVVSKQISVVY
jgi:hypothetical protein